MPKHDLDKEEVDAFAGRMVELLNGGFLSLMTSVGHRTGLFDAMAELPASTSEEIAGAAGLNERYVREWLGAMVTGRIVDHDHTEGTYVLPREHAASLTRVAGPDNIASLTQWISCMGDVECEIVNHFRKGGGVPYSAYGRFHEIMAAESGAIFDANLINRTLPIVPGLVERLKAGIGVADVGCGSGHAINLMARAFPKSRFAGYDFSGEGIAKGTAEARDAGLTNVQFEIKDVAGLETGRQYDFITAFDAIHDQAQPAKVLRGISNSLRPDGTFLMVDIAASSNLHENLDHPMGPFFYSISTLHCMTVSLALGGAGLGTVWGEQKAREMLAEAGFTSVEVKRVPGDIINFYYIAKKS